jgi:prephenate dehydrogenase
LEPVVARTLPVIPSGGASADPPPFERIGILGLGLVGASLALAARRAWPRCLVIGVDRHDVLERAMVRHAVDVGAEDPGVLAGAELVVLAAPISENMRCLAELPAAIDGPAIVSDVGSTKRAMCDAARALPPRFTFVGGHPLAGAARGGIEFASPDLFRGRPWILTPADGTPPDAVERLFRVVRAVGGEPRTMPADAHDRLVAHLSHVPQLTASSLMRVVGDELGEEGLALAGRGLADTTRLASSPADVWIDICQTNADEIAPALDRLIAQLQSVRDGLHDRERLIDTFEAAARWRATFGRER